MSWLERQWQGLTVWSALLLPLSRIFGAVVAARRYGYRHSWMRSVRVPVPVVVVGNISVGGTGKTPLVIWLARFLRGRGMNPGIVSRGYGAETREAQPVHPDSDPARVGDEPLLLARRSGCPVWIGADRAAAARALLDLHRACDVLISDDGLQHYGLARDVEIAVIDGQRRLQNARLLPAGPLREPPSRLAEVDAVVINGAAKAVDGEFRMSLQGREFRSLLDPTRCVAPEYFRNLRVHAIAAIGNPGRFFEHVRALGVEITSHAFPDHHPYRARDLAIAGADAIVMTEKDAVKCVSFASERHWVLPVEAVADIALGDLILTKLKRGSR